MISSEPFARFFISSLDDKGVSACLCYNVEGPSGLQALPVWAAALLPPLSLGCSPPPPPSVWVAGKVKSDGHEFIIEVVTETRAAGWLSLTI